MTPEQIQFAASLGGLAVIVVTAVWKLRGFEARQTELAQNHDSHERICEERYQRIADAHEQLVRVSDERHKENRDRLQSIDGKVDRLLERRR